MIVSVLIPTRGRIHRLNHAIESIVIKTPVDHYEILLRFDDDDWGDKQHLKQWPNTFAIHGPRFEGYNSLNLFYTELARQAKGDWLFIFNDDATLSESGYWTEQLAALPKSGVVAHPEWHQLNKSRYHSPSEQFSPFPIIPRSAMEEFTGKMFHPQVDIYVDKVLRGEKGWQSRYVSGMTILHERTIDETLPKERY